MPIFLDTRGRGTLGIGICDRCRRKMSIEELYPDPNSPGLRVCLMDRDEFDPYRLPARQPDVITLQTFRPDVNIATDPAGVVTESDNQFIINEDKNEYFVP
jgi:hypothetical protein